MVEPTTCTESTRGAISSCTLRHLIERQRAGQKSGGRDHQSRVRSLRSVQQKGAAGARGGLRHHADAIDGGDLRAGNRGARRI